MFLAIPGPFLIDTYQSNVPTLVSLFYDFLIICELAVLMGDSHYHYRVKEIFCGGPSIEATVRGEKYHKICVEVGDVYESN